MRTFDKLSELTDAELLTLVDMLCSTEELRQLSLFARAHNLWQMAQPQQMHRRTLYPQIAAHRFLEVNYANQN
ncbi:MAG: hypothetical protein KDE50_34450 [Caldilineaceae bacterium]|nr:hypothetical protein [Caldilineaceae bacterium]